jgi:outer membrane protein assembly factor BamE (lipoprotein component of BamABCDE complex)
MRWPAAVAFFLALTVVSGCISIKFGREFPSPDPRMIAVGKTDKTALQRTFGEPYQVGLDSGDQTWRWFYGQRDSSSGTEISKDLTVRFNPDGTVKAYAFTSNFPEDMQRLK